MYIWREIEQLIIFWSRFWKSWRIIPPTISNLKQLFVKFNTVLTERDNLDDSNYLFHLEIRLCTPNPCQHKGSCQVISNTKYSCDCTNTGYVGDQCQIGELKVPEFPQMQVAIESDELVIKAKPDIQLTITLDTELPDSVVFTPSNTLQIVAPRDEVTFKVTPKRKGLIRIKYVLSGADSFSFVQPRDGVIYALESVTNNRLSSIPGMLNHFFIVYWNFISRLLLCLVYTLRVFLIVCLRDVVNDKSIH